MTEQIDAIKLDMAREHHRRLMNAFTSVEHKSSFLLIIVAGILTVFSLSNLWIMIENTAVGIIHLVLIIATAIFLVLTAFFVINVIKPRKYKGDDPMQCSNIKDMTAAFEDTIKNGQEVLFAKHRSFKIACVLLTVALSIFLVDLVLVFLIHII